MNQDKIERDSLFDGYYALSFSDDNMKAEDISSAYHHLWKIEESFSNSRKALLFCIWYCRYGEVVVAIKLS